MTDSVSIGCPTYSFHDCDIPLETVKHRYCPYHREQDLICVVTAEYAEEGHRTCNINNHRELVNFNAIQNKAMFQLKLRLSQLKVSQPRDSMPEITSGDSASVPLFDDEEVMVDSAGIRAHHECG